MRKPISRTAMPSVRRRPAMNRPLRRRAMNSGGQITGAPINPNMGVTPVPSRRAMPVNQMPANIMRPTPQRVNPRRIAPVAPTRPPAGFGKVVKPKRPTGRR